MPGQFEAFTSDGMLALATDVTGLEFLNSVVEVSERSADALPDLLAVLAGLGAPMPVPSDSRVSGEGPSNALSAATADVLASTA